MTEELLHKQAGAVGYGVNGSTYLWQGLLFSLMENGVLQERFSLAEIRSFPQGKCPT